MKISRISYSLVPAGRRTVQVSPTALPISARARGDSYEIQPLAASETNAPPAGVEIKLFNGRDLSGWEAFSSDPAVKMEQVWSVKDGVIVCKGEPMGYLHTVAQFKNYRLSVDYRWAPGQKPGNSGIFGRINGEPKPLPRCLETQLKHESAGDLMTFHGMKLSGNAERFKQTPNSKIGGNISAVKRMVGSENPAGEWNRVEIVVNGGDVTVSINGQKVNEAKDFEVVAGFIGLQSEGGEVQFRNVVVTPLP